jgi:hypothetical protein
MRYYVQLLTTTPVDAESEQDAIRLAAEKIAHCLARGECSLAVVDREPLASISPRYACEPPSPS